MRRKLLGAVLTVLMVAGCAAVPTKGAIRSGEREGQAPDLGGVGVEAKPPRANVNDLAIVGGFLEAMSDSQAYDVARQYMTPNAAGEWRPDAQTVVYEQGPDSLTRKAGGVQLTARKIATIGARGEWTPAGPNEKADFFFELTKVDGQLRVASVPPGAYLGSNQVDLKLAPRELFFFNQTKELLVPDQVWLPQNLPSGQAATQLVQELLKGPTSRLGNGVVSLAPPGTEVQVSVPVDLGVATVALNDAAASLRDQERRLLAAQIVWTLNQLNLRAKITVNGAPLLPDEPEVLPFTAFSAYDPQVPAGAATKLYGLLNEKPQRILGLDGASDISAQPIKNGPLSEHKAKWFAVGLTGDTGAIVTADESELVYGKLDPDEKDPAGVKIPLDGATLPPSFDDEGKLWFVDRVDGAQPRLRVRTRDGAVEAVETDFKGDTPVALKLAPDGVRALLVMRSAATKQNYVQTATIQTAPDGKKKVLAAFRPLRLALTNITDAAWNKQGIIVIGAALTNTSVRQAWLVSPDGSSLQLLPGSSLEFVPAKVASNPNKDTLPVIQDDAGRIHWLSKDLAWVSPEPGDINGPVTPTYPG